MPKYFCDYCDTYLTHDSPSVRKTHNNGRKHKENVKLYYQKWMEEKAQSLIDQTTAAFQQKGDKRPTKGLVPTPGTAATTAGPGAAAPGGGGQMVQPMRMPMMGPGGAPGMMPMGMRGMVPPGPPGMMPPGMGPRPLLGMPPGPMGRMPMHPPMGGRMPMGPTRTR